MEPLKEKSTTSTATSGTGSMSLGNVLVIGGCGFLGSTIVDQLLNFPSETDPSVALPRPSKDDPRFDYPDLRDRFPSYKNTTVSVADLRTVHNRLPGAKYYEGDITSAQSMLEVFKKVKPDVVIHTASPDPLSLNKKLLHTVNVGGTKTLLRVAGGEEGDWGGKCKAFIYTSSSSVVHDTQSDLVNVTEEWPYVRGPPQQSYYSETKADAEEIVLEYNRVSPTKMLTCAIRPAGIIGEKDTTFTYKMMEHALKASRTVLRMQLGNNDNLFDTTYVGNISYAHMLAAQALLATYDRYESGQSAPLDYERVDGQAFNITNDSPAYFWDVSRFCWSLADKVIEPQEVYAIPEGLLDIIGGIVEGLFALAGKTPRMTRKAVRYSCMVRYFSCAKAKARLGYKPLVPLEEGLTRAAGYVLASGAFDESKKKSE